MFRVISLKCFPLFQLFVNWITICLSRRHCQSDWTAGWSSESRGHHSQQVHKNNLLWYASDLHTW